MRISDWSSDVCSSDLVEPLIGARRAYLHREVQNAFIATRDDAMHLRCQFTARVLMREIPARGDAGMAGECRRADRIDPFRVVGDQRYQQPASLAPPGLGEIGRAACRERVETYG